MFQEVPQSARLAGNAGCITGTQSFHRFCLEEYILRVLYAICVQQAPPSFLEPTGQNRYVEFQALPYFLHYVDQDGLYISLTCRQVTFAH